MASRVIIAAGMLGVTACATTPAPRVDDARAAELAKAQIFQAFAEPCSLETPPNPALPADAPQPPPIVPPGPAPIGPAVFLDTAWFLLPSARASVALPASRERLTADPEVQLLGTPHLFATFDAPARAVFDEHTGPLAEATLHDITVIPKQTADGQLAIELDTGLLLPTSPTASESPAPVRIHFVAAPRSGQPVALTERIPGRPDQSLLILLTPYAIQGEAELRAIFTCKMARRQRALASTR